MLAGAQNLAGWVTLSHTKRIATMLQTARPLRAIQLGPKRRADAELLLTNRVATNYTCRSKCQMHDVLFVDICALENPNYFA